MFLEHFGMTYHPFGERPAQDRIFRDDRMERALARLDYLADEGTIALVTGATGVGKSTLLRLFIHSLSRNRYRPAYIHLTPIRPTSMLRLIVTVLGEKPRMGKDRLFLQILDKAAKDDKTIVLVVDEAHLLPPEALTDIRLIVSSALDADAPMKIVLSGQESLRRLLTPASHADLLQRISVRCHLSPFTAEQTVSYIDFRLRSAGASDKLFDPEAKRLLHDFAGGVARLVDNLAAACLVNAASKGLKTIAEPLVNDTIGEFQLP